MMSRLPLPILAVFASAIALSPATAIAQQDASAAAPAAIRSANTEVAALDLAASAASSGSSSSSLSSGLGAGDVDAGSSLVTQVPPVAGEAPGSRRPFSGLAVGLRLGLGGVGFDVATPLVPGRLNLRSGASFISYTPSTFTVDNMDVNGSLKFQNASVMADFFPFKNFLRLSGGMTMYNNTTMNATISVPNGQSISVGGTNYYSDPSAPLTGTGNFTFGGRTAGRVSIGTGNMLPRKGRFTFESEIGVQFFSEPTIAYTFFGEGCQNDTAGVYTNCGPIPASNVSAEETKLQNDLNDLRYFPVFSIGFSYKIH